jgi:transcriptional regulator with XRE-family HTH domain
VEILFEQVLRLCKKKGITICKLERELNMGNGTIRKWRASSPRLDKIERVAAYFGTTVDALLKPNKASEKGNQ